MAVPCSVWPEAPRWGAKHPVCVSLRKTTSRLPVLQLCPSCLPDSPVENIKLSRRTLMANSIRNMATGWCILYFLSCSPFAPQDCDIRRILPSQPNVPGFCSDEAYIVLVETLVALFGNVGRKGFFLHDQVSPLRNTQAGLVSSIYWYLDAGAVSASHSGCFLMDSG